MSKATYHLIFDDGEREVFDSLSDLFKSELLMEAEAVFRTPALVEQAMIGAPGWEDYTAKAARRWAIGLDLYDEIVPPMFQSALEDEITDWRNHYIDGTPRPDGEPDWQQEERQMYRAAAL